MLNQLQPILTQATRHKKGRKAKSRPIFVSKKTEVLYLTALNALIDEIHKATVHELNIIMTPQIGDSVAVADGLFDRFMSAFANFSKQIKDKVASLAEQIAKKIVGEQKKASDKQLSDMLFKQTGIDLTGLMNDEELTEAVNEAIGANVALIKSIPQQYLDRVELAVLTGLQNGELNKTLADELQKIHNITRNRAELIASDQLGKINSRLSQVRQQALGITHYTWSTSQDERVRHEHVLRDGQLFAWDNPPSDGHPGQPIRCRCVAIPYTEHLLGGKSPEEAMAEQENSDNVGNQQLFDEIKQAISNQSLLAKDSKSLLDEYSQGLLRDELPHVDEDWGKLSKALRHSNDKFAKMIENNITPPPTWGIHQWSIDSRYISEIMRGNKNERLKDNLRDEFADGSRHVIDSIKRLFLDNRSQLKQDTLVYRGVGISIDNLNAMKADLRLGNTHNIKDKSFQSNTTDYELAKMFAERNGKNNTPVKVIYHTLLKKGVKALDITPYHFYYDNEILLDGQSITEVLAMRKIDEDTYEAVAIVSPNKPKDVGDGFKSKEELIAEMAKDGWTLREAHHDDPRDEHWSGYSHWTKTGRPLSEVSLWD